MLKTGITFMIDGMSGELIKRLNHHHVWHVLRRYDNGEYEYADEVDQMVVDATEDDEFFYIDANAMLGQIEDDTCRAYTLA